jgi:hypothetical protein
MFRAHVVQAQFGDCLILEYGTKARLRYTLIDGGPPGNFDAHVEPALAAIVGAGGKLDLVVASHVDNDHIVGTLDLLAAIEDDDASDRPRRTSVAGLWHNSFGRTLDPSGTLTEQMQTVLAMAGLAGIAMPTVTGTFLGLREGDRLRLLAKKLKLPSNKGFKDDLIQVETAKQAIKLGPLELRIAGPSRSNLEALRREWRAWLAETAEKMASNPTAAAMTDRSVPNLSSIVIMASCQGKTLLLTGDARGDHIIEGLTAARLAPKGRLHVDVLKVQHHGSKRNVDRNFFEAVTADTYVVSADGKYGNPDLDTLIWIVDTAHDGGRPVKLVVTNETDSTRKLLSRRKPSTYGYELVTIAPGEHSVGVTLSG